MAVCKSCASKITKDEVACDGVCGGLFHAACLRRASRSPTVGLTTCSDCVDIKPCHVLRLVKGITASLSTDISLIADRISVISSNWAGLQLFTDDLNGVNTKIDGLFTAVEAINEKSSMLLERSHELSSQFSIMSSSFDDLRVMLADCDLSSISPGAATGPIFPIMEDIRRNIRLFKGDLGSWSAAVDKNSELINTIASDIRKLASHGSGDLDSAPPTITLDRSVPSSVTIAPVDSCTFPAVQRPSMTPIEGSNCTYPAAQRRSMTPIGGSNCGDDGVPLPVAAVVNASASTPTIGLGATTLDSSVINRLEPNRSARDLTPPHTGAITVRPAKLPRSVFVSRVHPETTEDDIIAHLTSHIGAPRGVIACRKLNSSNRRHGCSFTSSFKVLIPEDWFDAAVSPDIWPSTSIVREFVPNTRTTTSKYSKNSSMKLRSTTQM